MRVLLKEEDLFSKVLWVFFLVNKFMSKNFIMIYLHWFERRIQMRMFQRDFYEKLCFQAWIIMLKFGLIIMTSILSFFEMMLTFMCT